MSNKKGSVKTSEKKVGPTNWNEESMNNIKESQQLVKRCDKHLNASKATDPVPGLRTALTDLSNNAASNYMRTTRYIVYLLRDTLIDVNEQVKSLLRCRDRLEKTREKIEQDVAKNNKAQMIRNQRPARERIEDDADGLLKSELMQLQEHKKCVDAGCLALKKQLSNLESSRRKLQYAIQDRSKVLGLAPDTVPIGSRQAGQQPEETLTPDDKGPYTPEVHATVEEAKELMVLSVKMRENLEARVVSIVEETRDMTERVNGVLSKKINETQQLKGKLSNALDENRMTASKAQKNFNETHHAWNDLKGPENGHLLDISEKGDRPLINAYLQHRGTKVFEAENAYKGSSELLQSLHETSGHVAQLKMSEVRLAEDIADKRMAIAVDRQAANFRRRKHID